MKSPSIRKLKCCFVLTEAIDRTRCCCFITQCHVITLPSWMENGNWVFFPLFFFWCYPKNDWKATEESLGTATGLKGGQRWELGFQMLQFECWKAIARAKFTSSKENLGSDLVPVKRRAAPCRLWGALWESCCFPGGFVFVVFPRELN